MAKTEYEKEVNKLARLHLTNAEAYEKFANELLEKHGINYRGLAEADEMVKKAKAEYEEIKSSCDGNKQKIAEKVNEIRRRDYFKGSLLMDCGIVAGDLRNVREEKPKTQSKQSVTAHKEKSAKEIYSEIHKMEQEKRIEALAKLRNENKKMYDEVYRIDNTGGYVTFPWKEATEQAEKIAAKENAAKVKIYNEADKLLKEWNNEILRSGMSIRLKDIKQNNPKLYEAICNQVTLDDYFDKHKYNNEVKTNLKAFQQESNAGQENTGQVTEGNAGSGRSGGTGSRAGGNSTRTTGNMTLDRACSYGPTALMEFIEQDLGHPIDASNKRKGKTGNDYVPTSKMKAIVAELSEDDRAKLEEFVKSDKFQQKVDEINARDQYTPSSRSAAGGERSAASPSLDNNGLGDIEFKEGPEADKAKWAKLNSPSEKSYFLAGYLAENGIQIPDELKDKDFDAQFAYAVKEREVQVKLDEMKKLTDAEKNQIIASSKFPVPEDLKTLDEKLEYVTRAELGQLKPAAVEPEKPKEPTEEEKARLAAEAERKEQFDRLKGLSPEKFAAEKEAAKQFPDDPACQAKLKLMEDVEKYVKLEKQLKKDADKAAKLQDRIAKAHNKGKEEKAAKLTKKKEDLDREIAAKEAQKEDLRTGMKGDHAKAADAQTPKEKKGNIFKRAGNFLSDTYGRAKDYVEKKKVKVTENKEAKETTYTLTGFEGRVPADMTKLTNGSFTVKHNEKGEAREVVYKGKNGREETLSVNPIEFERALQQADLKSQGKDLTATFLPQQRGGRE